MGDLNTFGGNGMGAAVAQSNRVLEAIDKFDRANANATALVNHRAAPTSVDIAQLRARLAFNEMNQLMNAKSLNYLNNNTFGMRPTTTVTGRPAWEPIPVGESADVQRLRTLTRAGRVVGPGFILLDGYMRASNVHNSWQNGDPNWQREAVVEGASFGLGIGAGVAIGLVVAVTPVGLAIGIVAGGAAAVGVDYGLKGLVGGIYDWWRS
ncbi:MAG: hypothetical protein LAT63_10690 [Marinobacter sp.]|nr:hypothetical protein [Marinobacter sp.]